MATLWKIPTHLVSFSRFGFEGWILVLIASVPDLCILFTSFFFRMDSLYSTLKFYRILFNFHLIHRYLSLTTTSHGKYSLTLYFFMLDYV